MDYKVPDPRYVKRLEETILKLKKLNPLRNDFDMYLFDLCEFALGNRPEPKPEDYGLNNKVL